jgi:uncharacterized protein (TIGR02284 family)
MNELNNHDIKVLNELIVTTLDSVEGYAEAAKDARNPTFKTLFSQWSKERRQVVRQLQDQVRTLGGDPDDDGSTLAAAHRVFLNLRDSFSKGDKSVVDEVERGEDFIMAKYEDALEDDHLSASVRPVVSEAYESVLRGHDQARNLKHAYQ